MFFSRAFGSRYLGGLRTSEIVDAVRAVMQPTVRITSARDLASLFDVHDYVVIGFFPAPHRRGPQSSRGTTSFGPFSSKSAARLASFHAVAVDALRQGGAPAFRFAVVTDPELALSLRLHPLAVCGSLPFC